MKGYRLHLEYAYKATTWGTILARKRTYKWTRPDGFGRIVHTWWFSRLSHHFGTIYSHWRDLRNGLEKTRQWPHGEPRKELRFWGIERARWPRADWVDKLSGWVARRAMSWEGIKS